MGSVYVGVGYVWSDNYVCKEGQSDKFVRL